MTEEKKEMELYKSFKIPDDIKSFFPESIGYVGGGSEEEVEFYFRKIRRYLEKIANQCESAENEK